jgi:hypothetical protein
MIGAASLELPAGTVVRLQLLVGVGVLTVMVQRQVHNRSRACIRATIVPPVGPGTAPLPAEGRARSARPHGAPGRPITPPGRGQPSPCPAMGAASRHPTVQPSGPCRGTRTCRATRVRLSMASSGFHTPKRRRFTEFSEDNMSDSAAALTYYGVLAMFPGAHRAGGDPRAGRQPGEHG